MTERKRPREGLPEAPARFVDGILAGAGRIRRYEKQRRLRARLAAVAAAILLLAVGLGALTHMARRPRPDSVITPVNPQGAAVLSANPRSEEASEDALSPESGESARTQGEAGAEDALSDAPSSQYPFAEPEDGEDQAQVVSPLELRSGDWATVITVGSSQGFALFRERPSSDSRKAQVDQGTLVRYLDQAPNGYCRVMFCGVEGYMLEENLRPGGSVDLYVRDVDTLSLYAAPDQAAQVLDAIPRHALVECHQMTGADANGVLWARVSWNGVSGWVDGSRLGLFWQSDDWKLYSADISVTDASGNCEVRSTADSDGLLELQQVLELAEIVDADEAGELNSIGALLTLNLRNDVTLHFTMPLQGKLLFVAENGMVLSVPDLYIGAFWSVFPNMSSWPYAADIGG